MKHTFRALTIGILLAMAVQHGAAQSQTGRQTVWDGVYTNTQASRGQAVYSAECANCHREDLSGYNGALAGRRFMEEWREDHLYNLFNTIRITMPRGAPASLSDEAYIDVVSYVLQVNGFPEGVEELTGGRLRNIQLIGKDGPQPVPDFALIQVVGCMTRDSAGAWLLRDATDPVRTREPGASSDEELESVKTTPPATQSYKLVDIEFVRPVFQAAMHEGHRLQAKGFLNRRAGGDQISLTALQSVSPACP